MTIKKANKQESTKETFLQARRVLRLLRILQNESRIGVSQIAERLLPGSDENEARKQMRSVRRVVEILREEGFIDRNKEDGTDKYFIAKAPSKSPSQVSLTPAETLSFYLLKSFLERFQGSTLASEIRSLSDKIDLIAPGNFFAEEFFFEQIPGAFEFENKPKIMLDLIRKILSGAAIRLTYRKHGDGEERITEVFPYSLFDYEGLLYLSAYHYKSGKTLSFALANIVRIEESFNDRTVPEFDSEKFRLQRFAVSDGELKNVKLVVKENYSVYFSHRRFHPSQRIRELPDRNLELTMQVPIAPDFLAWVMHWVDAFVSAEPIELKNAIRDTVAKAKNLYEN